MEERTVVKRNGSHQRIIPDKIKIRMERLMEGLNYGFIHLDVVVNKVSEGIYDGVLTSQLDNLAAETCAYMSIACLLYTSPSPRDRQKSRMPSSA